MSVLISKYLLDQLTSVTTSRAVDLNLAGIWCKALGGIFCGNTALEGKATCGDVVLGQTKLFEGSTSSNLDLCGDDIDTGDFLGDGVLDLTMDD
jgi:hypothetical protein